MRIIKVSNFEAFSELYKNYQEHKDNTDDIRSLILLFVGGNDPQTGESWCSDCRASKPVIDKIITEFQYNNQLALALIDVGQKDDWKRVDNPFRLHELKITAIPTLISLKAKLRLVESECADPAKVSHLVSNSM